MNPKNDVKYPCPQSGRGAAGGCPGNLPPPLLLFIRHQEIRHQETILIKTILIKQTDKKKAQSRRRGSAVADTCGRECLETN